MDFVASTVGVIVLAIGLGLLTNVLYVVCGLEQVAIWLREHVHWVCARISEWCCVCLWRSLVATVQRLMQQPYAGTKPGVTKEKLDVESSDEIEEKPDSKSSPGDGDVVPNLSAAETQDPTEDSKQPLDGASAGDDTVIENACRSMATSFWMAYSKGQMGFFPWLRNPCTWILLLAVIGVGIYFIVHHRSSSCTAAKIHTTEHFLVRMPHHELPSSPIDAGPRYVYKVVLVLSAVCLLAAIVRNQLHHLLRYSSMCLLIDEVDDDNTNTVSLVTEQEGEVIVLFCRRGKHDLFISALRRRVVVCKPLLKKSWSEIAPRSGDPPPWTLRCQSLH